jgi:uncharacterized HAD superfamily protein
MHLIIDIDDVLANTLDSFVDYHNKKFKTNFTRDDFYSFDWWTILGETKEKTAQKVIDFFNSSFGEKMEPKLGAKNILLNLKKNHKLSVITGRPKSFSKLTHDWIDKYFFGIFSKIYFAEAGIFQVDPSFKAQTCKKIGGEFFLEDQLEYAKAYVSSGIDGLIFDAPWNRSSECCADLPRVSSWEDVPDILV